LFFCHDADRSVTLRGEAYAPLADSVREDLENRGYACATIAHPWSVKTGSRAWGRPVSVNKSYFRSRCADLLLKAIYCNTGQSKTITWYLNILEEARPQVVIAIGSPANLVVACRQLGIKSVELLHGVGMTNVAAWGWHQRVRDEIPDVVLSLDDVSSRTFKHIPNGNAEIIQIPHPFLKRFVQPCYQRRLPEEWCHDRIPKKRKRRILVCLQWGYNGESSEFTGILPNGLYPEQLTEAIIATSASTEWCFRFHPVQMALKRYRKQRQMICSLANRFDTVSWELWSNLPLPALLPSVDGCISMASASCYEAAMFGVPSLLMCPSLRSNGAYRTMFEDIVSDGYAQKISPTATYLIKWAETEAPPLVPRLTNLEDDSAWENAVRVLLGR